MKKNLFIFICCLLVCRVAIAQEQEGKKEKIVNNVPHAIVYLKDGTTAEGYLQNFVKFMYSIYRIPSASDSEIVLKPDAKLFTKSSKFKNCDIDSMAMWYDKYPDMKTKWEPQFVDFTFGNNVSELDTHPSMVGLEYQGKHVKGYISYHMLYGFKLLYKTDEMPCAKAFVKPEEKFSEKRRKYLLETFNMYPEMEAYIKGLTKKEFKEDRLCILRKLDDILSASNAHK